MRHIFELPLLCVYVYEVCQLWVRRELVQWSFQSHSCDVGVNVACLTANVCAGMQRATVWDRSCCMRVVCSRKDQKRSHRTTPQPSTVAALHNLSHTVLTQSSMATELVHTQQPA